MGNLFRKNQVKMRDEARQANATRHRRRRKKNYTLYYILILFLILVTGTTLSITVFFNTEQIVVKGNDHHTAQEIVAYTEAELGDNLFRMNLTKMEEAVMSQTVDLDHVKISRVLPDTLSIQLQSAEPQAVVYNGLDYYILSSGGRIIEETKNLEDYSDLLFISGMGFNDVKVGDFVKNDKRYQNIKEVLVEMEKRGLTPVTAVEISSGNEIKLCCQDRLTIYLGSVLDLSYKMDLVKQLVEERVNPNEEGIIDVRFEDQAIFRPMTMANQVAKQLAVNRQAQPNLPDQAESETSESSSVNSNSKSESKTDSSAVE